MPEIHDSANSWRNSTFLEEITGRLTRLRPEQFVEPEAEPGPDVTIVGIAPQSIRCLYAVSWMLEYDFVAAQKQSERRLRPVTKLQNTTSDILELLKRGLVELTPEEIVGMQDSMINLCRREHEFKTITTLLWMEVRRAFPVLLTKEDIGVYREWKVGWTETRQDPSGFLRLLAG